MNKKFDKELKLLHRKNEGRCSICKVRFPEDEVIFTSIGYNKRRKLQITTYCCDHEVVNLKSIGIFGAYDPDELEEIIQEHPRYGELLGERILSPASDELDEAVALSGITEDDLDIVANTMEKYFSAQAVIANEEDIAPEAFREIEEIFTEKYNDPEIAQQKCILILEEISSFIPNRP